MRLLKKHIQWIGLSDASHDILALLLIENYWSGETLTPEEISKVTGYSRGTISVSLSQLKSLGFIDGILDPDQKGRGRKRIMYAITDGLSGIISFGVKKLDIELSAIIDELGALREILGDDAGNASTTIIALEEEAQRNIIHLKEVAKEIRKTKARAYTIDRRNLSRPSSK
jgi:DNA-binding transcriptional regulator GbsR (MarR family)